MIPTKQTVYLPVRVEDELPAENMQVAILHKEWGFTSGSPTEAYEAAIEYTLNELI